MTIICVNTVGSFSMHSNMIPAEETMQLSMVLTPRACLYHQVRRFYPCFFVRRQLTENRFISAMRRVAHEKLDKKRLLFSGYLFPPRKRMPPPVISLISQGAVQHAGVPGYIMMIKHFYYLRIVSNYSDSQLATRIKT